MHPLYFRITDEPDPEVFTSGWVEITADRGFVLDRSVWRADGVSRSPEGCVALRVDHEDGTWELKNRAQGRVVILHDGAHRYDVLTGMATTLWPGTWKGTLTEAFTFVLTSIRPLGSIRGHGQPERAPELPADATRPRGLVMRAEAYLDKHRTKRLALAFLWRQHLAHTTDLAEDLTSAEVGRAFEVSAPTVTGWREDFAAHVFGERGHQHLVRDLVIKHGLMTRADVAEADWAVARRRRGAS